MGKLSSLLLVMIVSVLCQAARRAGRAPRVAAG